MADENREALKKALLNELDRIERVHRFKKVAAFVRLGMRRKRESK